MRDYRLNWHPRMQPLGPAVAAKRKPPIADHIRKFEADDYSHAAAGWKDGAPPAPGWYIGGTINSGYGEDCCAHFDGSRWTRWYGLKDNRFGGLMPEVLLRRFAFKWLREATASERALDPNAEA